MLISLRIPDELLAHIESEAAMLDRSRNWIIIRNLTKSYAHGCGLDGEGVGASRKVPVESHLSASDLLSDGKKSSGSIPLPGHSHEHTHDPATCRIYKCGMCAIG